MASGQAPLSRFEPQRKEGEDLHEYALVQDLIEQVLTTMNARGLSTAKLIEVNVGGASGYSAESLKQAFDILSGDTELSATALMLKEVDGQDVVLRRIVFEE